MIQIQNLSKDYGSNQVFEDLNLIFERGKVYGIVGENGSGKTTLFRCIAGLEYYKGKVLADKLPLKNHLGFLMAESFFFTKMTGLEYLQLLCNSRGIKINNIEDWNIFSLPLSQYASTYSTGMKKKLAITGVLIQKNDYFILDEPFNGVDIQSNIIITELIHKLKDLDKVVIMSSHIFSTLCDTCDQIHLLKDRRIQNSVTKESFDSLENELKGMILNEKMQVLDL